MYSAEVWDAYEGKDVEVIHTKFCRWILNVKKFYKFSWPLWGTGAGSIYGNQKNKND